MATASVSVPEPTEEQVRAKKLQDDLNQQVRDEIGDDENIKFPAKNMLLQKYGVIPPVLLENEIEYWGMRGCEGDDYESDFE